MELTRLTTIGMTLVGAVALLGCGDPTPPPESANASPAEASSPSVGQRAETWPRLARCANPIDNEISVPDVMIGAVEMRNHGAGLSVLGVPEEVSDARASTTLARIASSEDSKVLVAILDANGPDTLLASSDGGSNWIPVGNFVSPTAMAVSPDGSSVVVADGLQVTILSLDGTESQPVLKLPDIASLAVDDLAFVDHKTLLAVISEHVAGVSDDFASLANVWRLDLASSSWTRLTDLKADSDRWTLAHTPVADRAGTIKFVVESGLGSGTQDDITTELWVVEQGGVPQMDKTLPIGSILVGWIGNRTVINVPDDVGLWHILVLVGDAAPVDLGCVRASAAARMNGDPDFQ